LVELGGRKDKPWRGFKKTVGGLEAFAKKRSPVELGKHVGLGPKAYLGKFVMVRKDKDIRPICCETASQYLRPNSIHQRGRFRKTIHRKSGDRDFGGKGRDNAFGDKVPKRQAII